MIPMCSMCFSSCVPACVPLSVLGECYSVKRDTLKKSKRILELQAQVARLDAELQAHVVKAPPDDIVIDDGVGGYFKLDSPQLLSREPQPEPQSELTPNPSQQGFSFGGSFSRRSLTPSLSQQGFQPQSEPQSAVLTPNSSLHDFQLPPEPQWALSSRQTQQGELELLREKISKLQMDLETASVATRAKSDECEILARALRDVKAERDNAMCVLQQGSEKAADITSWKNDEFTRTTAEIAKKDNEFGQTMQDIVRMDGKLRRKDVAITQKENEVLALQNKVASTERELNEVRETSARFQEESRRLVWDLNQLKDSLFRMREEHHEKDLQLNQKSYEVKRTFIEITKKDDELSRKLAEIDSLDEKLRGKNAEISKKDDEMIALRNELMKTDRELKESRMSSTRYQGTPRQLVEDFERNFQEHNHLKDSLSALREEYSQLQERAQLQKQVGELVCALEELTKLNGELREQLNEMGQLQERGAKSERECVGWQALDYRLDELHAAFAEVQQALRYRYRNQSQDTKGAIKVYVRVRPIAKREAGGEVVVRKLDAFQLELDNKDKQKCTKLFTFDSIFDESATQEDVFAECRSLVSSAIDGFNVTVFAYGQTGAGKTHTMYGSQSAPGLIPRFASEIFVTLNACAHDNRSTVRCSMLELYCDDLFDLLLPAGREQVHLEVKKDAGGSVYVSGATERVVRSRGELLKTVQYGLDKRRVAATKMNADSSRSHLIVAISIECINKRTEATAIGKLTLCDLAGSERLKKSQVTGDALKEAQSTNKSLSALVDVIEAASRNAQHIPYRNHKLTQLLSDSIGGNAKTLMFVNCSPVLDNAVETASSLSYAARAKLIVNKIEKNQDTRELARLKKVIQELDQFKTYGGRAS